MGHESPLLGMPNLRGKYCKLRIYFAERNSQIIMACDLKVKMNVEGLVIDCPGLDVDVSAG